MLRPVIDIKVSDNRLFLFVHIGLSSNLNSKQTERLLTQYCTARTLPHNFWPWRDDIRLPFYRSALGLAEWVGYHRDKVQTPTTWRDYIRLTL